MGAESVDCCPMLLRGLAVIMSFVWWVASARASDVDLSWRAPAHGCPEHEDLLSGLAQRLEHPVTNGPDAAVHVTADVLQQEAGYVLSLRIDSKQGTEQRNLRAVGCNELAQATVLIAALFVADRSSLQPSAAALPEGRARKWYVRAQLIGDLGTFPAASLGPSVMVGLALADLRIELGGAHMFDQALQIAGRQVGYVQLTTAAAAACYGLLRRPYLAPCLVGELGRLAARGDNLAERQDRALLWAMGGASARASVELFDWLRWHAEVAAGFPWDRAQFGVAELGAAHRVASLIGRLSTGLEGSF